MFFLKQLLVTSKGFFAGEQEDAIDNLITVMDLTNAQWWVTLLYLLFLSLSINVIISFSLSDSGEDGQTIEALKCKNTFNPVRQRVFQVCRKYV